MTSGITELENLFRNGLMSETECLRAIKNIISNGQNWWTGGSPMMYTDKNKIYSIVPEVVKPVEEHKEKEITKPVKNLKSNKKRKAAVNKNITPITDKNINIFIEKYLKNHPEIIENYLKENLRIDFKKVTTNVGDARWALALFLKDKAFSSSTLGLNIY